MQTGTLSNQYNKTSLTQLVSVQQLINKYHKTSLTQKLTSGVMQQLIFDVREWFPSWKCVQTAPLWGSAGHFAANRPMSQSK